MHSDKLEAGKKFMKGNKENILPSETWQIFLWTRQQLSIETIMQAFGVASSQAYRYCEDPSFNPRRNPLENIRILFEEIAYVDGGEEVVQIALNYLAQPINGSVQKNITDSFQADKQSLHEKLLENHLKFVELEQAMLLGSPLSHVQVLQQQAKTELDQVLDAYKMWWDFPK